MGSWVEDQLELALVLVPCGVPMHDGALRCQLPSGHRWAHVYVPTGGGVDAEPKGA